MLLASNKSKLLTLFNTHVASIIICLIHTKHLLTTYPQPTHSTKQPPKTQTMTIHQQRRTLACALVVLCMSTLIPKVLAQQVVPTPVEITLKGGNTKVKSIERQIDDKLDLPDEGYTLDIVKGKAIIRAKNQRAYIWGLQTLKQLVTTNGTAPLVHVKDYPAFPIRGFMVDTGRNFIPHTQLKAYINLLSLFKVNVFHWHLTDNPAWRIECKVYPQLNDPQYQRKGRDEGKFYTYNQIREVIAYAKSLGVSVIPEIDMPGHSQYFDKTFGFGMATEKGKQVLKACLEEFFNEISKADCPIIHIGSDEIHIDKPAEFIAFCEDIAQKHGREVMVWDPGLPASAKAIAQIWRENQAEAVNTNAYVHRYVDSYMGYLNKGNPFTNVNKLLLHTPCGVAKANDKALGGILCLWNDVRADNKSLLFPHNGMPQALLPFAERFWHGGMGVAMSEENVVPQPNSEWHKKLVSFEKKMVYLRNNLLYDYDMRWVANASQPWRVTLPTRRGAQKDSMKWVNAWGGVVNIMEVAKRHNVKLLPTMDAWMETEVHVDRDTVITAWVGFETTPRSSRISDGIGYQGEWESQGRLFANGTEVFPSEPWKEPAKYRYHYQTWHQAPSEIPFTNEQFFWMRQPAKVKLKAGWNKISLYCPRVFPNESWFVAFIPVHIDNKGHVSEAQGVTFR